MYAMYSTASYAAASEIFNDADTRRRSSVWNMIGQILGGVIGFLFISTPAVRPRDSRLWTEGFVALVFSPICTLFARDWGGGVPGICTRLEAGCTPFARSIFRSLCGKVSSIS